MNEPVSPLEPRLLDALRAERAAPAEARERVRARLAVIVPELQRTSGGGGHSGPNGAGGLGGALGGLGSHATAIAAFFVGGAVGAALLAGLAGSRPPRVVYVERPAPIAVAAAAPRLEPAPAPPAVALEIGKAAPAPGTGSHAPSPHAQGVSGTSRFAAERLLLDAARAAMLQGEPARAVDRLEEHRKRFADGLLGEERDAMLVEALVQSSRYDEARGLAKDFHARSPDSLFAATVDSAIATIP